MLDLLYIFVYCICYISPAAHFRNFIGMLSSLIELSLLIFCRIFLTLLCIVGCIVKESSLLCAGSSFINGVNLSVLLLILPVSFAARVQ